MSKYIFGAEFEDGKRMIYSMADHYDIWEVRKCFRQSVLEYCNWHWWHEKKHGKVVEFRIKIDKDFYRWKNGVWQMNVIV